jgi:hypothetical protein
MTSDSLSTTQGTLYALAAQVFEFVVFAAGLLLLFWAWQWLPAAWSRYTESPSLFVVFLAGIYCILGAIPFGWKRRLAFVAFAAFLTPLWIVGWIDWRLEYFFIIKHADAWQNLPRVILAPMNLGVAALLCACAVLGQRLAALPTTRDKANAI